MTAQTPAARCTTSSGRFLKELMSIEQGWVDKVLINNNYKANTPNLLRKKQLPVVIAEEYLISLSQEKFDISMKFDKILENNTLWAVRFDGEPDNALHQLFSQWNDPEWLINFFIDNMSDLESYFKITDINQAIYDTIDDSMQMQCLILDLSPEANLDKIFRPLQNNRTGEMVLGKEKARIKERQQHASWLRIYAIKLEPGCYIITGGAIKLTRTMQEREHTLAELNKIELVRNFLLSGGAIDADGFVDFLSEI
jgi:hypothetical protein